MKRALFERKTLDEHYEKPDTVNVRFNKEEREWLEALKLCHNTENDSTALKNEAFKVYKQLANLKKVRDKNS